MTFNLRYIDLFGLIKRIKSDSSKFWELVPVKLFYNIVNFLILIKDLVGFNLDSNLVH